MSYNDIESINPYGYQPNFILVNKPSKGSFFGDIVPVYRTTQELSNVIVTSWEGLSSFILNSSNFLVCVLSFLSQAINNTAYQSYLIINSAYQQVLEMPEILGGVSSKLQIAFETLAQESTRELWWLEVKLDVRTLIDQATSSISSIWKVLQKFYLAALIFLCLGFLNLSTPLLASNNSNSFLTKFLNNNSYVSQSSLIASKDFQVTTNLATTNSAVVISTVSVYTVKEGDTLDKIAESFGIKTQTICFNNYGTAEACTMKVGDKLYIPWVDGYIYNLTKDVLASDLSSVYGLAVEEIINYNNYSYNPVTLNFPKDSLVLIPGTDFAKISEANKKEQARLDAATKSAEQAARTKNLSSQAIPRTTALPDLNYMKGGFIWPTVGFISRCVQPGHIACDIANHSSPAIVASKAGTVTAVYRYDVVGYGLAVVVDHGRDENGRSQKTLYAHMSEISVSKGQKVNQGDQLGVMGQTGYASGIHLHYECIIDGVKQDPLQVCLP
jgi:murein DD-endopeptidase MepM/ murein hydrolase activator NlpD